MTTELTPKQEMFAQKYVELGNASEAYRQSYDVGENTKNEAVWVNASKELSKTKVSLRVFELQKAAQLRNDVTVDSITAELDEARLLAKTEKQPSAMVSASTVKAKMHGLIVDRKDHSSKDGSMSPKGSEPDLSSMTAEELDEYERLTEAANELISSTKGD